MNNLTIGKKQLGRAVAVVMTVGSLLGVIASPAMAIPGDDTDGGTATWTLEVDVTNADYCDPILYPGYLASWSPDPAVVYTNGDNTVDYADLVQTVGFTVDLRFAGGSNDGCALVGDISPTGTVYSSFAPTVANDPNLIMSSLDCSAVEGCSAATLFSGQSSLISGLLDVGASDIPETRTGTLTVEWIVDDNNPS